MTWEETDSEGVQLQSASSIWEDLESQNEDGNSPTFSEKGRYAKHMQDKQMWLNGIWKTSLDRRKKSMLNKQHPSYTLS
jgi:hypothetical protein